MGVPAGSDSGVFRGRDWPIVLLVQGCGAEGATAPETLRQTDRETAQALWKALRPMVVTTEGEGRTSLRG